MVRVFALILVAVLLLASACSKKQANVEESNTNAETETQTVTFTDANEALAEGNRLLDENQTQAAIDALRQAVKLNPDLAEAYFKLGIAFSLAELEQQQNGAITDQPTSTREGRVKSNSEKAFDKAVVAYKKWLDANPNDDVAWFNLGRTYYKLGDVDQAEKALGKAAKVKPDDTEYQTEWGAILIKLAKFHEAIPPLKKALEIDPSNARAEDLLDEAQAGARRLDYVSPKKEGNQTSGNSNANSNSNTSSNSASNTGSKPPANANIKKVDIKPSKSNSNTNRPHLHQE